MNDRTVQYDDNYCLLRISAGDEQFFNLVFEKYRNRLFTYLLKITKSKETAEEIVLDVFLKLWHGREIVHTIENLEAFLFRVAYHKAVDFFRTVSRSPKLQEETWELSAKMASYEPADKKLMESDINEVLQTAVKNLSPQRRAVYYLRNYEGLSYTEIAQRLNLSNNTVRNHLAASLQFIRDFLVKNDLTGLIILFFL